MKHSHLRPFKTAAFSVFCVLSCFWQANSAQAQTPPPSEQTRELTRGSTTLTVHYQLHSVRDPAYNVQVQGSDGLFTEHTPDEPRTYIGTVAERPGAIAAGLQRANGTFLSYVVFEDGTAWSSSGTTASSSGNASWPAVWPTTGVGSGGAGSNVRAAQLGIDASYRQFTATGSNVNSCVELTEFYVMKANIIFLRDLALTHRIGRFIIRANAGQCPYESTNNTNTLLTEMGRQWNWVLASEPHNFSRTHALALMAKPGINGGVAWTRAIANNNALSVNNATSNGDFSTIWRHEAGHNWGSSHFEGGGEPEGRTIMSGNSLARFSSSEIAKILPYRDQRAGALTSLGAYPYPVPPRANQTRVWFTPGHGGEVVDVISNDSSSNALDLSVVSFDDTSRRMALVGKSPGTGPGGRDQLVLYSPPTPTTSFDYFNYRIRDTAGLEAISRVYARSAPLAPPAPLWTPLAIGGSGGDVGSGPENASVVYAEGGDISGTSDSFRFKSRPMRGDGEMTARIAAQLPSDPWAKAGVMIRAGTDADAPHAFLALTPSNDLRFIHRPEAGADTSVRRAIPRGGPAENWLRLTREGDLFTAYVSTDGTTWTASGSVTVPMPEEVVAGLAVAGISTSTTGGAAFNHVHLGDSEPYVRVVEDRFEGGTAAVDSDDPLDTRWLTRNFSLSVVPDGELGSGNTLRAAGSGTFGRLTADFAGRALAAEGDVLRLSFDLRFASAPPNVASGFRFGFFNSSGAGYALTSGTGGNTTSAILRGAADGGFGSGSNIVDLTSATTSTLSGTDRRHARLELRRTAEGVRISGSIDGETIEATEPLADALTGFDLIAIRTGNLTAELRIDNVLVESFHSHAPVLAEEPLLATGGPDQIYAGDLNDILAIPQASATFELLSGPSWLQVAADGTVSGMPTADDLGENTLTVRVTNAEGVATDASVGLWVAHPVAIAASPSAGGKTAVTITRSGPLDAELTVPLLFGGDARSGVDYEPLSPEVVIPAGNEEATFDVTPFGGDAFQEPRVLVIGLAPTITHAAAPPGEVSIEIGGDSELVRLINDRFDSLQASPENDPDDPLDAAWTATNANLSVVEDDQLPGPEGNKALNVAPSSTFSHIRAPFDTTQLAEPGDTLTLSFDVRFTSTPANTDQGFRFGFTTADGNGLFANVGTGGNTGFVLREVTGGGFGGGSSSRLLTSDSVESIDDTRSRRGILVLQRTANGIGMSANFDGTSLEFEETSPDSFSYGRVVFRLGNLNTRYRLDNIRVDFRPAGAPNATVVPLVRHLQAGKPVEATLAGAVTVPFPNNISFTKIDGPEWLEIHPDGSMTGTAPDTPGTHNVTFRATDTTIRRGADFILTVHTAHALRVVATSPFAQENGGLNGEFQVTRDGPLSDPLTVHFELAGTARPELDYEVPETPLIIPAGESSATVQITAVADDLLRGDETVTLQLLNDPTYFVEAPGEATVTILDGTVVADLAFDTFDVGANPTPGNDSDDPNDLNWNATSASLSVVNDDVIGTGNALHVAPSGNFAYALGRFAAASLNNPGDRISLEFDFRYTSSPPSNAGGMRFGFTSFNRLDETFVFQQGTGGNTSGTFLRNNPGSTSPGSGSNLTQLDTTGSGANSVSGTTARPFSFSITKTTEGYLLEATVDGVTHTAFSDVGWTGYDAAVIRNGGIGTAFRVDNVKIRTERNLAPYFTSYPQTMADAEVDSPYFEYLVAVDPNPGDILEFSSSDAPAWLSLDADGEITGTPGPDDIGTHTFTARVADQHGLSMDAPVVITVLPSVTGIEAWRIANFGDDAQDPLIAGDDADPDHDGIPNLIEYALAGLDPMRPGPNPTKIDGNMIVFQKDPEAVAAGDVEYRIEISDDLGASDPWTTATPTVDNDEIIAIEFAPTSPTGRTFVRLRVTRIEP